MSATINWDETNNLYTDSATPTGATGNQLATANWVITKSAQYKSYINNNIKAIKIIEDKTSVACSVGCITACTGCTGLCTKTCSNACAPNSTGKCDACSGSCATSCQGRGLCKASHNCGESDTCDNCSGSCGGGCGNSCRSSCNSDNCSNSCVASCHTQCTTTACKNLLTATVIP